ncbi:MAG: DsbC family protein [Ketobacter sp.]|uniref:DsbC family protein n=1 Tax=Ketobacter sp. MCCC 1A13808 TaxID=2602738 RepID=UPI0018DCB9ED|nr:DsbC family protein [Ketobacter sp. MCCC 1A13808]
MINLKSVMAFLMMVVPFALQAAESKQDSVKAHFVKKFPQVDVSGVSKSDIEGIFQLETASGELLYVSEDGKYIITGDMLKIDGSQMVNLSEEWRIGKRVGALHALKDNDMVVYPAKGEEKGEVLVFTDTSCGYCRKFHTEIPQLNQLGVTVKYLAWPRAGLQSPAGQTMVNIWCSKDRPHAMTDAKSNKEVPAPAGVMCDQNVLQDQINLGQEIGVRGTPAVFSNDGRQLGGYMKAGDLADKLGVK